MSEIVIVGSGASGVHFALTLLRRGYRVTLLDAGLERPKPVLPDADFNELKRRLDDPCAYFLGTDFEGALLPDFESEYYGIPPSKSYVFEEAKELGVASKGFAPLFSFARGGLAEAWTGGCYPLNDAELADFPFSWSDLEPHYSEVARRVGVTGVADDLARFMPLHDHLLEPLDLDEHSRRLVRSYERHRRTLTEKLGCWFGRTRVATLSRPSGRRGECAYLGRCLWGCPVDALYTPSATLAECLDEPGFTYVSGCRVEYFRVDGQGRASHVVGRRLPDGGPLEIPVERLALAAGALTSTRILLRSVWESSGEAIELSGLMDNRQVLVPFVNLGMLGRPFDPASYQYHLLGLGLQADDPRHYVHGQITTLKTAMMHPVMQQVPLDLRTSIFLGRELHAALGVVNVNFHDTRREENRLRLDTSDEALRLSIRYTPPADEPRRMREALSRVRRALRKLGCIVPPGMSHVRPMGASVHYAGTVPMSPRPEPWTTDEFGRSREFDNVWLVDGATFPFLPAKNLTFTLMANAVRIAEQGF